MGEGGKEEKGIFVSEGNKVLPLDREETDLAHRKLSIGETPC